MSLKNETIGRVGSDKVIPKQSLIQTKRTVPVRKPVTRSKGRVVGYYPSIKGNSLIAWESQLELKACRLFEFCPTVVRFKEQPLTIFFRNKNKLSRYTPDFELTTTSNESVYVEIKPLEKLQKPEELSRLQCVDLEFKSNKRKFIVITDKELEHGVVNRNLALLRSYKKVFLSHKLISQMRALVNKKRELCLHDLFELLDSKAKAYSLIANRYVQVDLSLPLNPQTLIRQIKEIDYEKSIFSYRVAPEFK